MVFETWFARANSLSTSWPLIFTSMSASPTRRMPFIGACITMALPAGSGTPARVVAGAARRIGPW